jgi:hypothetical protein
VLAPRFAAYNVNLPHDTPFHESKEKIVRVEVKAIAHLFSSAVHSEKLTMFSGVAVELLIQAIMFNTDACDYDVGDDGAYTMHDLKFTDGSMCYFEVLSDGTLSNFCSNAFVEIRGNVLVVSPNAVYAREQKGVAVDVNRGQHRHRRSDHGRVELLNECPSARALGHFHFSGAANGRSYGGIDWQRHLHLCRRGENRKTRLARHPAGRHLGFNRTRPGGDGQR